MRLLLTNGTIVTATDTWQGDVLVDGETIALLGPSLDVAADLTIDATGKLVLPGGIDVHTHLDMPGGGSTSTDDFETGTRAAALGGTTSLIDFATQSRGGTLAEALHTWHAKAAGRAVIDYGFHMAICDLNDEVEAELETLVAQGVTTFKLFMAYPDRLLLDDASIFRVLLRARENGGLVMMHAENAGVIDVLVRRALAEGRTAPRYHAETRPPRGEAEATHRAIALAELAGAPIYIVHVSCGESLEEVARARARGLRVFGETCPQYLCLDDACYDAPGFDAAKFVMSPPLRPKASQQALWTGLARNELQVVSTDHCPFSMRDQKVLGRDDFSLIPNGAPGIETRMSLVYDEGVRAGRISLNRFVEITSTAPARIFGLYPQKGTIAPGSDADLVVFDPDKTMTLSVDTLHMRIDYNPYEGRSVTGVTDTVLSRGRVIVERGRFVGGTGGGRFLPRAPVTDQR